MRNFTLPAILALCCTAPLAHAADATLDTISAQLTTLAQQNQSTANTLGHLSDQINAIANCGGQGKVWTGSACIAAATDAATGGMSIDLVKNDAFGAGNDVVATYCKKHPIVDGGGYRLITAQNNKCGPDDACKALGYSGAASYTPAQVVNTGVRTECGHDGCDWGGPTISPAQLRCFK